MPNNANNPELKSWLEVSAQSDFPIQNIPFGVFLTNNNMVTIGTRIGDYAIDLGALHQLGYFKDIELTEDVFLQDTLNDFISAGKKTWRLVRNRISEIFNDSNPKLRDNVKHRKQIIFEIDEVEMQLPVAIGDYTDFYSSKEHALNLSRIFSGKQDDLSAKWYHYPLAHNGRTSSIIPSGIPIHRPKGQILKKEEDLPDYGPSQSLDFELELGFITTDVNSLGESVPVNQTEDYIFGVTLFNDWSCRDMQRWECMPLGPFLSKNFACSLSPWIVTLDALEPFKVKGVKQEPKPLPYLQMKDNYVYDIHLEVSITPEHKVPTIVSRTNYKNAYWNMNQQLCHHTANGCKINSGDLLSSGAISGNVPGSYGSMIEITNNGEIPIKLNDGSLRSYIQDKDTVTFKGYCKNGKFRIGFGDLVTTILPVHEK